ncbi:hypothetical protein SEUCBS139899_001426 [Sporothrix eucalyptigena]|uniref:Uncharacterized protein n=1 Tax=Sporothrix eucalyptigena TaxID=1812306 RepID=A0ABP0B8K2_9PEZI
MTSYYNSERRGRSTHRRGDRYDDRYDDYGRYGYGRGDYTALDHYYPPPSSRRSKSSHRRLEKRSESTYSRPSYSSSSSSSSSSSRRSSSTSRELKHIVTSAVTAGALEAFRLRKTPGKWTDSHKAGRIATVAIGAAVADTAMESNNPTGKHTRRHVVESAVAGLLTDRLVNGSRKRR